MQDELRAAAAQFSRPCACIHAFHVDRGRRGAGRADFANGARVLFYRIDSYTNCSPIRLATQSSQLLRARMRI